MKLFGFGRTSDSDFQFTSQTATFLCAHPGSFTASAEQDNSLALKAMVRVEQHVAEVVAAESGRMLNAFNASFCAMFSSAPAALRAAIRIAPGVEVERHFTLSIRCGLHTGQAYTNGKRTFSGSIGTAQSLCSLAMNGGQVLVSDTTAALIRPHLGQEWGLQKCDDAIRGSLHEFYQLLPAEDLARLQRAVFISYRRDSGSPFARLIQSELFKRNVETFMDVDDLNAAYFDNQIMTRIQTTPNFVLILTPGCLDRCRENGDWLRREIVQALKTKRNIVPVMAPDFAFPPAADLPDDMAELPRHNGIPYSHAYAAAAVDRLVNFLTSQQQE